MSTHREALHVVVSRVESALGPLGGDVAAVDGTAPGIRLRADVAGVGPVFIKAGDGSQVAAEAVGAEIALLTTLSHRVLPKVLAADPVDDVPWMVQARLHDAGWTPPWPTKLKPVWSAIDAVSRLPPPPWLPRVGDVDPWAELEAAWASQGTPAEAARAGRLREAASRVSIAGDRLVHGDLGAGNVHVDGRRARFVDWSDAFVGNPDLDRSSVAVDVAHHSGRRVPPPVTDPAGWLAKTAGLLLAAAARPAWPGPGGAAVRRTQAELADTALDWAIELL